MSVTREDVVWAYRMLLGREPEDARVIESHLHAEDRDALRRRFVASTEFKDVLVSISAASAAVASDPLPALRDAFTRVDGYQPVYGFEHVFTEGDVSRACIDRCKFLEAELGADIRNLRILDVGCSMGYLSLFFAARGALVTGMDVHQPNVDFCKTLSGATGISASFMRAEFAEPFCDTLLEGRHDVAFLFSVLHHVTHQHGVTAVQRMMELMLQKCDVLYVELARKSEAVEFAWKQALPDDELAIFAGISDIEIERLGEFAALGGTVIRPLYRVRKTAKVFNGHRHHPLSIARSSIKDGRTRDRKYAESEEFFTKLFVFEQPAFYQRFAAELDVARRIGEHRNFVPVLGSELRGSMGAITYPRLRGKSLMDALNAHDPLDARPIALDVVEILRAFHRAGLHWNDFRSHNIILTGERAVAVDFESAAPVAIENTLELYLWLLYDLHCGRTMTQDEHAFDFGLLHVRRPPIGPSQIVEPLRDLAERAWASKSIAELVR